MEAHNFKIEILVIDWYNKEDNTSDRCAHGDLFITIGNEIVIEGNEWWNLNAAGLHLLRTLFENHTKENKVGDVLIPYEGHHINHLPNSRVHIETGGHFDLGKDWWVEHEDNNVLLSTNTQTIKLLWIDYKNEIIKLLNAVEKLFEISKEKDMPDNEYDKEAYLKFWSEWKELKNKTSDNL